MPAFEYEALDTKGKKSKGVITADSEIAARRELRGRALAPLSIRNADRRTGLRNASAEAGAGFSFSALGIGQAQLSSRELMLFTRQLASLIGAGMPVAETLGLIAEQGSKHHARKILMAVRVRVTEGERFSTALDAYPGSFPAVYRAMIAAGESAGGLPDVLERLADYLEKDQAVRSRITGAMIYPAVLTVVALGVITLLMTFVVPRLAEQFTGMGMDLPLLTQIMIGISSFLQSFWPVLLAGIFALIIAASFLLQQNPVRSVVDAALVRIPLIGGFLRHV